jgi:lipopolysaccharide/colanic/teichoic acid biosynthesis glycosyltransferase
LIKAGFKRGLEVGLAGLMLAVFSPAFLLAALLIRLEGRGPVFFIHPRVGKDGRIFNMFKFRTLKVSDKQGNQWELSLQDGRITRPGRFLRRWSLDELPQLINVIRGDMSFIGPRPGLPYQAAAYTPRQRRRLSAKPGITGWAQVNGRNWLTWEERIELDLWYLEHRSLSLELKILIKTVLVLVSRQGLYGKDGVNYDLKGTGD